jgi:two-component system, NtrC family, sensor histidine kinase HydH
MIEQEGPHLAAGTRARYHVIRAGGLLAGIGAIAGLHFVTDPAYLALHELYNYLCYVPIIFAAYSYGAWGGVAAAALTSAAFIPHIRAAWVGNDAYTASLYAEVVVFHVLGLTVGLLAATQRRLTARYRDAAISLERANRELRESQEHLRRADRLSALGEIAAGLAHEIQNPLAGVKGALEIITSRVAPRTPEAEFADIGSKELARLEGLVGEFLTYARPHDPALRPTDVHEIVERVAALLHAQAERKSVTLVLETPASIPLLSIDSEQITQVIFNVVLNAIQATPASGHINIREFAEPGWGVIDVIDEGPGIPPEHALRLFDPFFTTKPRGTGLGLAISQRIVTAHRGTIEALPGSPSGSVFRIRLPLPEETAGAS